MAGLQIPPDGYKSKTDDKTDNKKQLILLERLLSNLQEHKQAKHKTLNPHVEKWFRVAKVQH